MSEINHLYEYIRNPEDPKKNFNLAEKYFSNGCYAPAISYFLRCAERSSENLNLVYECLIRIGQCYDFLGSRSQDVKCMYKHAISILPSRPEAYFMLVNYENWNAEYQNGYFLSSISLEVCDFNLEKLSIDIPSEKWSILYQKSISAWWWGKRKECRKILKYLLDNYWDDLDMYHKSQLESRLCSLGSGPESTAFTYFNKNNYQYLRYKFPGSEDIEKNFSQVYQDMFILSILDGKRNGTFLEIGGAKPYLGNNTALLEEKFDWYGVSIEFNQNFVNEYSSSRPTKVYCLDALNIDYNQFINEHFESNVIDYLQLDIEPARNTYELLLKIPFENYKFAVITYEHDHYVDVTKQCRQKSREYLESKGYLLVVNDVSPDGQSNFEDWWVHPELVNPTILEKMMGNDGKIKKAEEFMLTPMI